jgi:hypothetical protein
MRPSPAGALPHEQISEIDVLGESSDQLTGAWGRDSARFERSGSRACPWLGKLGRLLDILVPKIQFAKWPEQWLEQERTIDCFGIDVV